MVQTKKMFVLPDGRMSELISENPYLMLMLEHFGIDLVVYDKTVRELCRQNSISEELFLSFANLFNGFKPFANIQYSFTDLKTIILFLKNSHQYYFEEFLHHQHGRLFIKFKHLFDVASYLGIFFFQIILMAVFKE